jgi:outer membrane protein OmpA-like peptidoglycan-associated protein
MIMVVTFFAGCATVPPNELVNARSAYQHASMGPAQQLVPAELHKAHQALDQAEKTFQEDSDSFKTKDLAYVAQRKAEQAEALAVIAADKARKDKAEADYLKEQAAQVAQGKQDLSDAEKRTAAAQAELDRQALITQAQRHINYAEKQTAVAQAELDKQAALKSAKQTSDADLQRQQDDIMKGKQELQESEKRTADALAALAALAILKEEERGLVLTLSGSVLFRSAESTLLPQAQVKLDQVAKALLAISARTLIVEGHTDSQGSNDYNQGLSQRRADAVREYLVQKGYPADRIHARGNGEGSPIAQNSSAEGRANNRRVEIVIEREVQASK